MHSQQFTNSGQQPTTLTRSFLNKQNGYKSYMMEAKDFLVSQSTFPPMYPSMHCQKGLLVTTAVTSTTSAKYYECIT